MVISITEIAGFINGKITGDDNIKITNLAKIEDAGKSDLTFLYLPAYEKYFAGTKAAAILVKPGFKKTRSDITYIEVKNPNKAFSKILIQYFSPEFPLKGIDASASVHPSAILGKNIAIGKNVVISAGCRINDNVKIFHNTVLLENVEVDQDSLIFQNVSIREKVRIGKRVIIHSGAVIGSDGFGYFTDEEGVYQKIPQIGIVILEDDVEIGANVTIDRAAFGVTAIKRGTKIDNLVQIAHNVVVGEDTVISAQTGISGSARIGNKCIVAGQVGIVGHIEIGDNIVIMAQSGISKSLSKPGVYFGSPAKEAKQTIKLEAHVRSLPDYLERIKELEKQVKVLNEELNKSGGSQAEKPGAI
jgi:UDP-3-O-[3-hydroxymyristoyl] glucosamine N-acyltransferase